jgi:hypothetical protein
MPLTLPLPEDDVCSVCSTTLAFGDMTQRKEKNSVSLQNFGRPSGREKKYRA